MLHVDEHEDALSSADWVLASGTVTLSTCPLSGAADAVAWHRASALILICLSV